MIASRHTQSLLRLIRNCSVALTILWMFGSSAIDLTPKARLEPTPYAFVPQSDPLHSPVDSKRGEIPVSEEKESSDPFDDDSNEHDAVLAREKFASQATITFSLRQLARSLENRPVVSLFVLHHSWKGSPA